MSFTAIRWALSQDSLEDPREALLLVVLAIITMTKQVSAIHPEILLRSEPGSETTTRHCETFHLAEKRAHYCLFAKRQEQLLSLKLESTLETESPPSSELNQVQNCTRFRTEPPPSSELNHLLVQN